MKTNEGEARKGDTLTSISLFPSSILSFIPRHRTTTLLEKCASDEGSTGEKLQNTVGCTDSAPFKLDLEIHTPRKEMKVF